MITIEKKLFDFKLKRESETSNPTLSGIASTFYFLDHTNDIIRRGAFEPGLKEFLETGFLGGLNHDWNHPIGKITSAFETDKGLEIEGNLSNTSHSQEVQTLISDGIVQKLSIGFEIKGVDWLSVEEVEAYWRGVGWEGSKNETERLQKWGGARLLTEIKLYEVSPVIIPANEQATITSMKSKFSVLDEKSKKNALTYQQLSERAKKLKLFAGGGN